MVCEDDERREDAKEDGKVEMGKKVSNFIVKSRLRWYVKRVENEKMPWKTTDMRWGKR